MFSEHKKWSQGHNQGKKFDTLEEKATNGISQISLKEGKALKKYTPESTPENRKTLKKDGTTLSASLILRSNSKKGEVQRCNSEDKKDLGKGLFEAASVIRNIVDITKDSTMKNGQNNERNSPLETKFHAKPNKSASKLSLGSSQSGPFAALKENAEKKKKSVDDGDE